jgi:hypothetical protein
MCLQQQWLGCLVRTAEAKREFAAGRRGSAAGLQCKLEHARRQLMLPSHMQHALVVEQH